MDYGYHVSPQHHPRRLNRIVSPESAVDIADMMRSRVAALNDKDLAKVMSFYSDHCIVSDAPQLPSVRGKKAVQQTLATFFDAFPDAQMTPIAPLISGHSSAYEWRLVGTHSGSYTIEGLPWTVHATGRRVQLTGASFTTYDNDGLIIELHSYWELIHLTTLDLKLPAGSDREALVLIHSALQRSPACSTRLVLGDVAIDFGARIATRGSHRLNVTNREFELLRYLADRPHMVTGRLELLKAIWGYPGGVPTRVVDQTVARLRRSIEPDPAQPRFLHTAHGSGYYLTLCQQ